MAATLTRRVSRKSRRTRQRTIAQETRRKLFLETLEDRRLLAGLDDELLAAVSGESSVVSGPWSVANDQGQRTTDSWQVTTDNGQRTQLANWSSSMRPRPTITSCCRT